MIALSLSMETKNAQALSGWLIHCSTNLRETMSSVFSSWNRPCVNFHNIAIFPWCYSFINVGSVLTDTGHEFCSVSEFGGIAHLSDTTEPFQCRKLIRISFCPYFQITATPQETALSGWFWMAWMTSHNFLLWTRTGFLNPLVPLLLSEGVEKKH